MKNLLSKSLLFLSAFILYTQVADAQRVALKTNVVDWATISPNLSLEVRLDSRFTLDLSATLNPIVKPISDIKFTHARFQPELRYWFNRPMARHFMGLNFLAGFYNVKFNKHYYDGDIWAAGLSYGYVVVLSKHWNMEATAGFGYGYLRATKYQSVANRPRYANFSRWLPIPTRLGLSFSYVFK